MKDLEKIKTIISDIKRLLDESFAENIHEVLIYGSYARGQATEDSDIDVMIVIDNDTDLLEVEEALDGLLFKILLDKKELVSVLAIHEDTFHNYNSPFLLNTREEGIAV